MPELLRLRSAAQRRASGGLAAELAEEAEPSSRRREQETEGAISNAVELEAALRESSTDRRGPGPRSGFSRAWSAGAHAAVV